MNRPRSIVFKASSLALALILLFGALTAMAQDADPTIKTASLRLWPEYDDPGLLVIFSADFADQIGFPRDISIPLPSGARNVQAAYPDASGSLLNADSQINEGQLTYKQLPMPAFHIEYYVDRQPSGDQREITHVLQAPFAIEALEITVQQPARATEFSVSPMAESSYTGDDGLTYHVFNRTNLAAGDVLEITLRYIKTDSGVSRPQLAVTGNTATAAAPTIPAASPKAVGGITWLPWVLVGAGATALAVLATYWLLSQRQQHSLTAQSRQGPSRAPTRADAKPAPGVTSFCTQCGHPHGRDDRFCAQCGAPRRG